MSRINHQNAWETEEHPSLEVLRQYQSGELPAPQSHQLERHLASCEMCSDLLGGMALSQPARVQRAVRETRGRLKNLLAQKKRKRKVFQWPVWQTAAVLLVLLFAIAEVVYHHYFNKPASHTTEETTYHQATWRFVGHVANATGKSLPEATVKVKGTDLQTKTDQRGEFMLNIPAKDSVLIVSHFGYKEKEVIVSTSNNHVRIVLTEGPE
ncbi:carboxypeptidase-like regulatory domain-containing protein [Rufibacter tibetensis]|uniref:Zinc-finger domain-containing protein n=1 Tax=Rufibacter tibetensis TaxID=512763 RepID=A0A0P0C4N2_9BACT|nr:carboxypeptidase-like regulatory domain-containing protein [Rufibacter tibetensis]ALJ00104.1 hypothetical protein DC20_15385 [Rufibacter tibetensis]